MLVHKEKLIETKIWLVRWSFVEYFIFHCWFVVLSAGCYMKIIGFSDKLKNIKNLNIMSCILKFFHIEPYSENKISVHFD